MSLFFKIDTDEICVSWSFAIISIISTLAINHADSTLPERQYVWIGHIFIILSLFYLYIRTSTRFIKIRNLGLFFLFVFWYLVTTTYRYSYDASEISFNLSTIAVLLVFSCYDKRVWAYSYTIYYKYMVLMSLLGIIAYISFHIPIDLPRVICPYYSERLGDSYCYYDYYFSYIVVEGAFIRLCGLFNEPGYFGTILALILVIENLNLKKKNNMILFGAGFFTFSAAFFITLILFVVMKMLLFRDFKTLLYGLILFLPILIWGVKNENVIHLLERLTFVDGKLNAINRTHETFDLFFSEYIKSPRCLIGYGRGVLEHLGISGNLSYKTYLVEYGLLACAIFWGGILVSAINYSKQNKSALILSILFIVNIYQRPNIFVFAYMLVLFGGISYILLDRFNNYR